MKAMPNVRDWTASGAIIFTVMNLVTFLRFYWAFILIVVLVSFIGCYYYKEGWFSLFYGIGAALMCTGFFSALATMLILLCVTSLISCDEDENE